ncbi:MAG: hypothetical protein JSR34_00975 [Proteobacteria bacterium]|nr:hypothetical protein [Pseudomonadota bacterium]
MHPQDSCDIADWRIAHHVHLSACLAVLNNTQVSELLVELCRKLPDVRKELLLRQAQDTCRHFAQSGIAHFFITGNDGSRDLGTEEALKEIGNPACWLVGGRYLAAVMAPDTSYFASIYGNLFQYARYGVLDA